ncbi:MAG: hypothetical protein R2851_20215 [Caldilineaceae bacterium]
MTVIEAAVLDLSGAAMAGCGSGCDATVACLGHNSALKASTASRAAW